MNISVKPSAITLLFFLSVFCSAFATAAEGQREPEKIKPLNRKAYQESFASMTVDVDGAPNAYGPDSRKALDYEHNAHNKSGKIVGYLLDKHGKPIIQGHDDPAPGFYISTNGGFYDTTKKITDPRRYVNAAEINYTVLGKRAKDKGIKPGDFCVVHSQINNKTVFAIVGDTGNSKGDEGSLALLQRLGFPVKDGKSTKGTPISGIVVRYFAKSNPSHQFFVKQTDLDIAARALNLDTDFSGAH